MNAVKHVTKKMVVYFLTLAMLLTIVPMSAFAAEDGTDKADVPVTSGTLVLDKAVSVSSDGDELLYAFTPDEDGTYLLQSFDYNKDYDPGFEPNVTVYDAEMNEIEYDSGSGVDGNLKLLCDLEAGQTYYYRFSAYHYDGGTSFAYSVKLVNSGEDVNVILYANNKYAWYDTDEGRSETLTVSLLNGEIINQFDYGYIPADNNEVYSFKGFSTDPNATEPDDVIFVEDGLELYAVWTKGYEVTFDSNYKDDTAYFEEYNDETYEYDRVSSVVRTVYEDTDIISYTECPYLYNDGISQFIGWSVDPNATEPDESIIVDRDMTVYAVWAIPFTVTFDANIDPDLAYFYVEDPETGEYVKAPTEQTQLFADQDIIEYQYMPTYDSWKCEFLGWSTDPDATEPEDSIFPTEDMTVYAVWDIYPKVTFDLNTGIDQAYYEIWDEEIQDYTSSRTTVVYYDEYSEKIIDRWSERGFEQLGNDEFLGWSTDPDAKEPVDEIIFDGDITVYAVWRHVNTVTLDANGGYFDLDGEDGQPTIRMGVSLYEGEALGTHIVYHSDLLQTFDGWYDQATGGQKYDEDTIITQDVTLYAHWKETVPETLQTEDIKKTSEGAYQATYKFIPDEDGIYIFNSADLSGTYPKVTLYDKDMNKLSDAYSQVSGGNFLFQNELKAGETYYFVINNNKQSAYAYPVKIAKAATAVVTFDVNRDGATMEKTSQNAAIGFMMNLNSFVPKTATEGEKVRFAGWSRDPESKTGEYYTTITEDTTLYAVWQETGTVTFHANHEGAYYGYWDDDDVYQQSETRTENLDVGTTIYSRNYSPSWENVDGQRIEFVGWSVDQNATEPDAEIIVSDGLELYAVWKEAGESSEEVIPLELDQEVSVVSDGTYIWYSFIPAETGTYCVESSDYIDCDPYIELFDADKDYLTCNDDGGNGHNFRLIYTLEAGNIYYLKARDYNSKAGLDYKMILTKPVTVDVTFYVNHADAYYIEWDADDNEIRSSSRTEPMLSGTEIDWDYLPETDTDNIMFAGWSADPNATEADDEIVVTPGLKLYAVWNDAVKITFDTNCDSTEDAWFDGWDEDDNRIRVKTLAHRYTKGSRIYSYDEEPNIGNSRLFFLGWSENKNATEPDTYIKADQSKTVYAVWGENAFVTYDANGGYFRNYGTICAYSILKGNEFRIERTPDNADPSKVFAGWATTKNAAEPNVTYDTVVNDDMTVYAVWKDGIKVTIDANGGYFYQNGIKKPSIDIYVLPGSTVGDLETWARNDDELKADSGYRALSATGENLDDSTIINEPVTLYVKWIDLVIVTFDAQDGLIDDESSIIERWRKGSERFLSNYYQATSNDPAKAFVGWSTKKGDASSIIQSLTPTQNTTLYAIYSDGYLITLESADKTKGHVEVKINGDWVSSAETNHTFIWPKGLKAENLVCASTPESGYLFKGLSTSKDRKDIISDSFIPTKNMTLYGIFVPGYFVSFDADEGTYDDADMNTIWIEVEAGNSIGNIALPEPPNGKMFDGWMIYDEDQRKWIDAPYEVTTHKPTSYEMYRAKYTDASGKISIATAQISVTEKIQYTGKEITPNPVVKLNNTTLKEGTDYQVSYSNNINVGTATVIITGINRYTGTRTVTFEIFPKNGWFKEDGYWYFYDNNERVTNTWKKDTKGWCYLGADGAMVTNDWAPDSKGWCWIASDGYMPVATKWIQYKGGWYHITKGYRDESKWMKDSKGWCWLQADGRMLTNGWAKDGKGWCWIASNGYMPTTTQWIQYNGGWYYIEKGYRVQNAWRKDSKGWCYLGADGRMVTNDWVKDSKGYCWIAANGYMPVATKWIEYDGGWYHITNGYRDANKWMKDTKGWCWLQADGRMLTNGWAKDSKGNCWIGPDGYMIEKTMKVEYEGETYGIRNGYMVINGSIVVDGVTYTFDANGKLVS